MSQTGHTFIPVDDDRHVEETHPSSDSVRSELLGDPALRTALERFVRTRVPESEAEDVVQSTLTDALASAHAPSDAEELRRWIHGIAKNKIVDLYRKRGREPMPDSDPGGDVPADSAPISARDLLRWAEKELPEGENAESTLEWMLREGSGEKLETIAKEEGVPAPRVRQRVTRMRKHFRSKWAAQIAAVALLAILVGGILWLAKRDIDPKPEIVREPPVEPTPEERAERLRHAAYEHCDDARWQDCLDGLDAAKQIDPRGDEAARVGGARRAAAKGLAPKPQQKSAPEPESETPPPPRGKSDPSDLNSDSIEPSQPPSQKDTKAEAPKKTNIQQQLAPKKKGALPNPRSQPTADPPEQYRKLNPQPTLK